MRALLIPLLFTSLSVAAQPFEPVRVHHLAGEAEAVAVADLDRDGQNEILVFTGYAQAEPDAAVLHVISIDQASGGFIPRASKNLSTNYVGRVGLVVAKGPSGMPVAIASNTGQIHAVTYDGESISSITTATTRPAWYLAAADLDGDGVDEVFAQGWGEGGAVYGFGNDGALQLRYLVDTLAGGWNDVAAGDVTGDGLTDVLVMSGQLNRPNLSVFSGDGAGGLSYPQTYSVNPFELSKSMAAGDLNGDGRADVVLARGANSPTWLWQFIQGDNGMLGVPTTISTYDIPSEIAIADLDGDGLNEVVVLHTGWGRLSLYQTNSSGIASFAQAVTLPYAYYDAHSLAIGDVNGDGCKDVLIGAGSAGLQLLEARTCVPPNNDLAVALTTSSREVHVDVRSIAGNTPAANVTALVGFAMTRNRRLSITAPAGCDLAETRTYSCHSDSIAVGAQVRWTFAVSGKGNSIMSVVSDVAAETPDSNASNNSATAEQRL